MDRSVKIPRVILRLLRAGLRRVFNLSFLATLSLLLGIGLGCLWKRSMRVTESLTYSQSSDHAVRFFTYPRQFGFIVYLASGVPSIYPVGWSCRSNQWDPQDVDSFWTMMWDNSWLGFKLRRDDSSRNGDGWHLTEVHIPLWFPMVLTLIAPLCWLRRWRRQAWRVRLGCCLHCGYDLRATPDASARAWPAAPNAAGRRPEPGEPLRRLRKSLTQRRQAAKNTAEVILPSLRLGAFA